MISHSQRIGPKMSISTKRNNGDAIKRHRSVSAKVTNTSEIITTVMMILNKDLTISIPTSFIKKAFLSNYSLNCQRESV